MEEIAADQACGKPLEIWFADGAQRRVGQKNTISRRWAKRGTRPSAPNDQRTASADIFGAICPAQGKRAGLVLPLDHRGDGPPVGRDRAGGRAWRSRSRPPRPGRRVSREEAHSPGPHHARAPSGQGARVEPGGERLAVCSRHWLSKRIFHSYEEIVDHCCDAWNKLVDQPWLIMSIGLREWAHRF